MKIFINNKFIEADKAKISILEQGYQYGYGLYDTLRTYDGKISNVDEHLKRLFTSAKKIGLKIHLSKNQIKQNINKLIKINNIKDKRIKVMVAKGIKKPTISIVYADMDKYTPDLYKKGISVITTNYQRALPEVKSMNYLPCILALKQAKKKKVFEALLIDNNCKITEGTFSNLFIVRNDTLITAKDNILNGITRNIVLKLAKPVFKKIILKNLMKTEIYKAEEAFLAVTTGEIIPITKIDGHKIKLGKYTKLLMAKYKEYIKGK